MAIKGKGKTRRRTVAAGPKPVYVEPPRALWRRRWLQVSVLVVVLLGIGAGVAAVLIHQGNLRHKEQVRATREKERAIVGQFGSQVDQAVTPVTQAFQQTKVPFPDLTQQVSALKPGQLPSKDLVQLARSSGTLAEDAAKSIGKIPATTLVSGHPALLPLIDSQAFLVQSLKVYQQASRAVVAASRASGDARSALLDQAEGLLPVGRDLFNDGYQRLVNIRTKLGLTGAPALPPQPSPPAQSPSAGPTPTGSAKGKSGGKGSSKSGNKSGSK
jgi:hypothetical protein